VIARTSVMCTRAPTGRPANREGTERRLRARRQRPQRAAPARHRAVDSDVGRDACGPSHDYELNDLLRSKRRSPIELPNR
jgi:hypothetical protein